MPLPAVARAAPEHQNRPQLRRHRDAKAQPLPRTKGIGGQGGVGQGRGETLRDEQPAPRRLIPVIGQVGGGGPVQNRGVVGGAGGLDHAQQPMRRSKPGQGDGNSGRRRAGLLVHNRRGGWRWGGLRQRGHGRTRRTLPQSGPGQRPRNTVHPQPPRRLKRPDRRAGFWPRDAVHRPGIKPRRRQSPLQVGYGHGDPSPNSCRLAARCQTARDWERSGERTVRQKQICGNGWE